MRICETCSHFQPEKASHNNVGYCLRHAPRPSNNSCPSDMDVLWPVILSDESCGEWADVRITPEQRERHALIKQIAVAIVANDRDPTGATWKPDSVARRAIECADAVLHLAALSVPQSQLPSIVLNTKTAKRRKGTRK